MQVFCQSSGTCTVFKKFAKNSTAVPFPAFVKVFGTSNLSDLNLLFKIEINKKMIYHLFML